MATDIAAQAPDAGGGTVDKPSVPTILFSAIAGVISGYFVIGASVIYWVVAAGGTVSAWIVPRALIRRLPLAWLIASAALTITLSANVLGLRDGPHVEARAAYLLVQAHQVTLQCDVRRDEQDWSWADFRNQLFEWRRWRLV
jgi:hypothetical protein